jgi:hypothetical protein
MRNKQIWHSNYTDKHEKTWLFLFIRVALCLTMLCAFVSSRTIVLIIFIVIVDVTNWFVMFNCLSSRSCETNRVVTSLCAHTRLSFVTSIWSLQHLTFFLRSCLDIRHQECASSNQCFLHDKLEQRYIRCVAPSILMWNTSNESSPMVLNDIRCLLTQVIVSYVWYVERLSWDTCIHSWLMCMSINLSDCYRICWILQWCWLST